MIFGSAATVSERLPPASCIRMIAPGLAPCERAVDDRVDAGQLVVVGVDGPQDHQHPVVLQQRQRGRVPEAVGRPEQARERGAVVADRGRFLEQLLLLLLGARASTSARGSRCGRRSGSRGRRSRWSRRGSTARPPRPRRTSPARARARAREDLRRVRPRAVVEGQRDLAVLGARDPDVRRVGQRAVIAAFSAALLGGRERRRAAAGERLDPARSNRSDAATRRSVGRLHPTSAPTTAPMISASGGRARSSAATAPAPVDRRRQLLRARSACRTRSSGRWRVARCGVYFVHDREPAEMMAPRAIVCSIGKLAPSRRLSPGPPTTLRRGMPRGLADHPHLQRGCEPRRIVRAAAAELERAVPGEYRILVVDDNSPDGTGAIADPSRRAGHGRGAPPPRQERPRPGLSGRASNARCRAGAELLIEMDADFSHDPRYLPDLISAARRRRSGARLALRRRRRRPRLGARAAPDQPRRRHLRAPDPRRGRARPDRRLQVHPPRGARGDRPLRASAPRGTCSRSRSPTGRCWPASPFARCRSCSPTGPRVRARCRRGSRSRRCGSCRR